MSDDYEREAEERLRVAQDADEYEREGRFPEQRTSSQPDDGDSSLGAVVIVAGAALAAVLGLGS